MPSSDSSTEQTTSPPPETYISIRMSDGQCEIVRPGSGDGSISTPEYVNGIEGLRMLLTAPVLSQINSVIGSFISTDLMPFLLKQSPGDLKALLQKYALEVRCGFEEKWHGRRCSYKFTIALYSKSHTIGTERRLLTISSDELSRILSLTQTL